MTQNQLYVILHGHFYQPPREDPWTNVIDRQPSAYPSHDWNERINKECYAANAASRVLNNSGQIEDIINNYKYLSFNFGPTLIDWLAKNDPYTLKKIVEADKASIEMNNGHGNAIAQVYNHIIMPLASDNDKITQIEWGLKHFEKHFGRKSEGMWLAETAVNDRVAEYLIDYGIKYLILAPSQAQSFKPADSEEWIEVSDGSIDPSKPYILKEENGEIAVFFYYGDIASNLSFQHLLRSAEYLKGDLLAHNNEEKGLHLIHTATDGEVYGHHEPFGDMCLARVVYDNRENKDFIFTNYGRFLEILPPEDECQLKAGNDGLGTAWSCAHGVDRWRRDCGCSTGAQEGWNQKWREPFRVALDLIRDRLYHSAEREVSNFLDNVWDARNDYIYVLMATVEGKREDALNDFFKKHAKNKMAAFDRNYVLRIMEALHQEMLMYTSCGWFFSEISGIETVQDMYYAARLMELADEILPDDTREEFLNILGHAKSNIPHYQDGRWIFENFVEKHVFNPHKVINQYLLDHLLSYKEIQNKTKPYYFYDITISGHEEFEKESWVIHNFEIKLNDKYLMETNDYTAYVFNNGNVYKVFVKKMIDDSLVKYLDKIIEKDNAHRMIRDFKDWFIEDYSLAHMKYDSKAKVLDRISKNSLNTLHKHIRAIDFNMDEYIKLLELYKELGVKLPDKDMVAIKELLNNFIFSELEKMLKQGIDHYDFTDLIKIIQVAKKAEVDVDYEDILPVIRKQVMEMMESAIVKLDMKTLKRLEILIDFSNISGIDFEKYEIQNLIFESMSEYVEEVKNQGLIKKINKETWKILLRLTEKFNIAVYPFESRLKNKK